MLSSASQAVPAACLRCELGNVITSLRAFPLRVTNVHHACRKISTAQNQRQEMLEHEQSQNSSRGNRNGAFGIRHIHPNGRIIGRPGRRQRQSSGQLATNSLGKPSEVILIRDVEEKPDAPLARLTRERESVLQDEETGKSILSAKEIENALMMRNQTPEQREVEASIEGLRPHGNILDKRDFDTLSNRLMESYNMSQLAQYLMRSCNVGNGLKDLSKSQGRSSLRPQPLQWRPGTTPLEERVGLLSVTRGDRGVSKAKLVDQILRVAWCLTVSSEEQVIGELELRIKPWQVAILFDHTYNGMTTVERVLSSPLLLRASKLRPYRPQNVVRITARKQDALEIADLLQNYLSTIGCLKFELGMFEALIERPPGSSRDRLFNPGDLKSISSLTDTLIQYESDSDLAIYGQDERRRLQARRLLLRLLDIPWFNRVCVSLALSKHNHALAVMMRYPVAGFRNQQLHHVFSRACVPVKLSADSSSTPQSAFDWFRKSLQDNVTRTLMAHCSAKSSLISVHDGPSPWTVNFCSLVQQDKTGKPPMEQAAIRQDTRMTSVHQVPGLTPVLSYFTALVHSPKVPSEDQTRSPHSYQFVVTRFIPSPFGIHGLNAPKHLPRITIKYGLTHYGDGVNQGQPRLRNASVQVTFDEREVNVCLPDQTIDLHFSNHGSASLTHATFEGMSNIALIKSDLEESMRRPNGTLMPLVPLQVRFPAWLLPAEMPKSMKRHVQAGPVEYILDRLEHVQQLDLEPAKLSSRQLDRLDVETRQGFDDWPEGMRLRMSQVEAGAFGGRRTELQLLGSDGKNKTANDVAKQTKAKTGNQQRNKAEEERVEAVVRTALMMAGMLTKANSGKLKALNWSPEA